MSDKVVIIGGGPVGLVCALALGKVGLPVTLVEAEGEIVNSPRAMGYHWPVLDGLDALGLLDDMIDDGFTLRDFTFRQFTTGEQFQYHASVLDGQTAHPYMLLLGQNRLARIVLQHLERLPNVQIMWNTCFSALTQDAEKVVVSARREDEAVEIHADWLIGADGGRSGVRKALGLEFAGITWPERFVATNVYYDFDKYGWGQMGFLLDAQVPAVIGKLDKEGLWRITYSESAELPLETLADRIPQFLSQILPGDKSFDLALYSGYEMHQRSAPTYRVGRVLLAGDSAHVTNPTSGFGLVGGLFDAFTLSEALIAVTRRQAEPSLLDSYSRERHKVYHEVTSPVSSKSFKMVFHARDAAMQERHIAEIRKRTQDPHLVWEWYQTPARLETPSLLTGQTLRQRRQSPGG